MTTAKRNRSNHYNQGDMGHKHTRDEILAGALETAFADGLSRVTYGRVARHLDISDRVVVYYFPTKEDLLTEVILTMGLQLQDTLASALTTRQPDHLALVRTVWPLLATPEADPVFALFFEANGLAASGRAPYHKLVPQLVEGWIDWTAGHLAGPADVRRTAAEAAIALIDGLILLRLLAGADAGDRAATLLGVA